MRNGDRFTELQGLHCAAFGALWVEVTAAAARTRERTGNSLWQSTEHSWTFRHSADGTALKDHTPRHPTS